jgi:hypothetical protein
MSPPSICLSTYETLQFSGPDLAPDAATSRLPRSQKKVKHDSITAEKKNIIGMQKPSCIVNRRYFAKISIFPNASWLKVW